MEIREAMNDSEIMECFPVMAQLRPHLRAEEFVSRVRGQMSEGYHLVFLHEGTVRAVAGFRYGHNLAWGHFLYVDDLIAAEEGRGKGFGSQMMQWILDEARKAGCAQVHLDSGVQRFGAHGFYLRHRFAITAHHFSRVL